MTIETHNSLQRLRRLCAGLCRDAGVKVVSQENSGWAWIPNHGIITVPQSDLINQGSEYCSGVLSHEVGHVLISRGHYLLSRRDAREKLRFLFLNGIEDPRVNQWIVMRYPGAAAWHREMADVDLKPFNNPLLPSLRLGFESAREQYLNWQSADTIGPVPEIVLEALNQTRADRIRYSNTLPPFDLDCKLSTRQVGELLVHRLAAYSQHESIDIPESAWERLVLLRQVEAIQLARQQVVPVFEALLDHEVAAIAAYLSQHRGALACATRLLRGDLVQDEISAMQVAELYKTLCSFCNEQICHPEPKPAFKNFCTDLIWLFANGVMNSNCRKPLSAGSFDGLGNATACLSGASESPPRKQLTKPKPTQHRPKLNECRKYEDAVSRLQPQVEALCRELDEIIEPRKRLRERKRMPSGSRVDLKQLVAFEADPRRYRELWSRKSLPEKQSMAVSLLVDLSGSMNSDSKIEAAFVGTVLLANVLQRQGVPFAINGFQDDLIPFHAFRESFNSTTGRNLEGMFEEVRGCRLGGQNHPETNADGPCLQKAATQLAALPETDRLLIVISDGLPTAPSPAPSMALKLAVSQVTHGPSAIKVVGLGLGRDTDHVNEFYPHGKACIPEEQLASEISGLIRRALLGLADDSPLSRPEQASKTTATSDTMPF